MFKSVAPSTASSTRSSVARIAVSCSLPSLPPKMRFLGRPSIRASKAGTPARSCSRRITSLFVCPLLQAHEKEGPGRLLRQSLPGPMYAAGTWCP